jgi:fructokinase
VILVAGESLIDLIVGPQGGVHASPGGGPFNTARTVARLGHATRFLGRFSVDPFGRLLRDRLAADRARLVLPDPVAEPTALAVVGFTAPGVPRYWFHLAGTASFMIDQATAQHALRPGVAALHIGTLGLVVEPMASGLEHLVTGLRPAALLMLDPNCRPQAIPDPAAYRARIRRILARTDIVKTSREDLTFLLPGVPVPGAARTLLGWGAGCVLVTDGPAQVQAFVPGGQLAVPVPRASVVDTVGAGDAFGGAFLAWWVEHGLARDSLEDAGLLLAAVAAAARVATMTCEKAGAEPPWRDELEGREGWAALAAEFTEAAAAGS